MLNTKKILSYNVALLQNKGGKDKSGPQLLSRIVYSQRWWWRPHQLSPDLETTIGLYSCNHLLISLYKYDVILFRGENKTFHCMQDNCVFGLI